MVRQYATWEGKKWTVRRPRKKVLMRGTPRYASINENYVEAERLKTKLRELVPIIAHLKTLSYRHRPDYKLIYETLMKAIRERGIHFTDGYDWESESQKEAPTQSPSSDPKDAARSPSPAKKAPATPKDAPNKKQSGELELQKTKDDAEEPKRDPKAAALVSGSFESTDGPAQPLTEVPPQARKQADPKHEAGGRGAPLPTIHPAFYEPTPEDVPTGTFTTAASSRRRSNAPNP
ncbi:Protein kinase domain-containing protein [Aphelenchoides fujianensis]|nr:Protein kinase domain-containing protein [Aphelenchoides fujianensis]